MWNSIKITKCYLIWFLFLYYAIPSLAQSNNFQPSLREMINGIESSYKGVKNLKVTFSQKYHFGAKRPQVEIGVAYFTRGGRMRWEYQEPEEKIFIANAKNSYLYVLGEKYATRTKTKKNNDMRAPFRLILQRPKLNQIFSRVESAEDVIRLRPENTALRCFPKEKSTGFQDILIEVNPKFDIRRIIVRYVGAGSMEFIFTEIKRNPTLSPSLFIFKPPEDIQIVDSH